MPKEIGYLVCRHKKTLLKEHETSGGEHNVDVSTRCTRGAAVALVHTHNVNPNPSPQDLDTAKEHRLLVCVDFQGKGHIKCYKVVD